MHDLFELVTFLGHRRFHYIILRNYVNVWFPVRSLVYIYIYMQYKLQYTKVININRV